MQEMNIFKFGAESMQMSPSPTRGKSSKIYFMKSVGKKAYILYNNKFYLEIVS